MSESKTIVAYVPVLHEGYYRMFTKYRGSTLYIAGPSLTAGFRPLTKELRALDPEVVKSAITAWNIFATIEIVGSDQLKQLATSKEDVILPDEDFSREIAARHLMGTNVTYDPIFLRWDRRRSDAQEVISADHATTNAPKDLQRMRIAATAAEQSSDIWRRVGAVIVLPDGHLQDATHNRAMPTDNTPWATGDPRGNYSKGEHLDLSLFIHAEAGAIAEAARLGSKIDGAGIYVTTFPCPACAKLIAASGIRKCYYAGGYAVLDGQEILEAYGVEMVRVTMNTEIGPNNNWVPYPKSS